MKTFTYQFKIIFGPLGEHIPFAIRPTDFEFKRYHSTVDYARAHLAKLSRKIEYSNRNRTRGTVEDIYHFEIKRYRVY